MTIAELLALAGVVLLGAMAPGPDFAVVLRHALRETAPHDARTLGRLRAAARAPAVSAAAGIAVGVGVWAVVAAVGLAGLLAASATAFTVVKLAGAAYLVVLGLRALYVAASPAPRRDLGDDPAQSTTDARGTMRASFTEALLTNLLNPKAAVFFLALWPQFLPAGSTAADVAALVTVTTGVTLAWFLSLGTALAALAHRLTRRIRRVIDGITGVALVAVGLRVATDSPVA